MATPLQAIQPVPAILFPALSSSELLNSTKPPFIWSRDSQKLLSMSSAFTPGQMRALQEIAFPGRWAASNISSSILLQPSSLSEVLPSQLKTNLDRLLEGIKVVGFHEFYNVARQIQSMPRHLVMAWLEEALVRYQADGDLEEDDIPTDLLLDQLTAETKPNLTVNNPLHSHPLAQVFDRWTAPKKTYLTGLLLTGLSCHQIKRVRTGDFLEILAVYR